MLLNKWDFLFLLKLYFCTDKKVKNRSGCCKCLSWCVWEWKAKFQLLYDWINDAGNGKTNWIKQFKLIKLIFLEICFTFQVVVIVIHPLSKERPRQCDVSACVSCVCWFVLICLTFAITETAIILLLIIR